MNSEPENNQSQNVRAEVRAENSQLKNLFVHMRGYLGRYVAAVLAIGIAAFFAFLGPLVLRTTIDSIIGDQPLDAPRPILLVIQAVGGTDVVYGNLWIAGLGIIAAQILGGLSGYIGGRLSAESSEGIAKSMREKLYDHIQHLPYEYHVQAHTGDLIQRCTSDVETVRRFLAIQLVEVGRALFMIAIACPIMLSLSPRLTAVALAMLPIIFAFSLIFFKRVQKAFLASDEAEGRLSSTLQENLTGVRVVRAFARQKYEIDKFDERNRTYRDLTFRLIRTMALYWSSSDFLSMLQVAGITVIGGIWAFHGELTIGTLLVFISYEWMLLFPIRQMGRILADMGKALVAAGRINEVLETPREETQTDALRPTLTGEVSFDSVRFSYDKERPILQDISFHVEAGSTVAILGPTGAGKSTLMHLLPRLYDPDSGTIRVDGVPITRIDKKWLRKNVALVLQEPFLFAKTIRNNIGISRKTIEDVEIFEATRVASVHDVIESFAEGYDTLVGERGVTLSGGQKQRVAIARALVTQSPILIFDDSLSAVDTETDAAIRAALAERRRAGHAATTFIISHRLATLAGADRIIVIEHGKIVQEGSHQELLDQEGLYRRLWTVQNALESEFAAGRSAATRAPAVAGA